jgi:hypothetical protein
VTARVEGLSFVFLDFYSIFLIFLVTWHGCLGFLESSPSSWCSCEFVRVRMVRTIAQPLLIDRETGPDLTWQWTLAVVVCAALAGVFKGRKYEIELN